MPLRFDVEAVDKVMFPEARGVPAVGRTWMPEKVRVIFLSPTAQTNSLISFAVGVRVADFPLVAQVETELRVNGPLLGVAVTFTAPVLKTNPLGAEKMRLPVPISAIAPSTMTGPVRGVKLADTTVSAEIAEPPDAGVTPTAAFAAIGITRNPSDRERATGMSREDLLLLGNRCMKIPSIRLKPDPHDLVPHMSEMYEVGELHPRDTMSEVEWYTLDISSKGMAVGGCPIASAESLSEL
jgi:hypothetical protein